MIHSEVVEGKDEVPKIYGVLQALDLSQAVIGIPKYAYLIEKQALGYLFIR